VVEGFDQVVIWVRLLCEVVVVGRVWHCVVIVSMLCVVVVVRLLGIGIGISYDWLWRVGLMRRCLWFLPFRFAVVLVVVGIGAALGGWGMSIVIVGVGEVVGGKGGERVVIWLAGVAGMSGGVVVVVAVIV
jgi:hypothetical protein